MSARSQSECNDPVTGSLKSSASSAGVTTSQEPLANAPTSFTLFNKLPPEIRRMVWKEAAQEEMKNRIVPFCQPIRGVKIVLLPALSSPLLKACMDSRVAFLPLVPTALKVFGCRKTGCPRYGCNCARPSGTLYINLDVDIAIAFYYESTDQRLTLTAPGWCSKYWVVPEKDVEQDFQRSITTIWEFWRDRPGCEDYRRKILVSKEVTLCARNSTGNKRYINYERFLCNEVEPETAEEQPTEETIGDGGHTRNISPRLWPICLSDFYNALKTMSGTRFLQRYGPLFMGEWLDDDEEEEMDNEDEEEETDDEDDDEMDDEDDDEMDDENDEKEDKDEDE